MKLKLLGLILLILCLGSDCKRIQSFFEEEKIPAITNPKMIKQELFELKYPSNWEYQEDKENKVNLATTPILSRLIRSLSLTN